MPDVGTVADGSGGGKDAAPVDAARFDAAAPPVDGPRDGGGGTAVTLTSLEISPPNPR